tara:strand:- start:7955 stop:8338 length:384 start_codon:yes stop_codon:yes gene_type:complete
MKNFTVDLSQASDFTAAWLIDAVANSAFKGAQSNRLKAAELLSEAKEILTGADSNGEIAQTKLNRIATRIEMHEEQERFFHDNLDHAAVEWQTITGKKSWTPYSGGKEATPKNATATNKFFAERMEA